MRIRAHRGNRQEEQESGSRWTRRWAGRAGLALAGLLLLGGSASGEPLLVSFIGNVTSVPAELSSAFSVGDPVSGSFVIESTTPDDDPSAIFGLYIGPSDFVFTFGGYAASAVGGGPGDSVLVTDDLPDRYGATVTSVAGPSVDAFVPVNLTLSLVDDTGGVFSSDALPATLNRLNFSWAEASIIFRDPPNPSQSVFSSVEFVNVEPVPEPAGSILLLLACVSLAAASRGRSHLLVGFRNFPLGAPQRKSIARNRRSSVVS